MNTADCRDFNIHLPSLPNAKDDLDLSRLDINVELKLLQEELKDAGVVAGNVMVLDTVFARTQKAKEVAELTEHGCHLTALVDPREDSAFEVIDDLAALGFSGIKFHPYFQNLADHDFPSAIAAARYAESKGLWLAVCCSYGTKRVFANSGVRLLAALAQARLALPMIALHSGGRLALEVMSIALETPNIYLDTSFSIPFWVGSSVETDIAFAIRNLGVNRCMFGSDRPYQPLKEARESNIAFLERHGFSQPELEMVMNGTFQTLCERSS